MRPGELLLEGCCHAQMDKEIHRYRGYRRADGIYSDNPGVYPGRLYQLL